MSLLTRLALLAGAALTLAPLPAEAADPGCGSGTITSVSESVMVEGHAAARAGDTAGCGGTGGTGRTIAQGSPDVLINGRPAAVQGATGCGGSIASGASGVFINGKPMARVGDSAGCPGK
ncbi:MAG: PAAR domain-containing protein [Methyloceanibacter sp.]